MSNRMRIAFFGSSLVSAYWNGAATYYRGLLKALYDLGHRITFFEPDAYDRQKHRDIEDPHYAKSIVYEASEPGLKKALNMARGADVIVKASGVGYLDDVLEEAVLEYKANGSIVIFWDVDAPATLDRVKSNRNDPFASLIPEYDMILTYGGGEMVVNAYKSLGAKICIPVYNALDPFTHYPVEKNEKFECSLGFLGNRMPDREQRVSEFFFKPASLLPEYKFKIGGNGWDSKIPSLGNLECLGHVYTHEHNQFNCSSMAILNINRQSMASYGFSPPTRIFEAAGAGACIITDKWDGIEAFLQPHKECFVASNGENVAEILTTIDEDIAFEVGRSARKRILESHTYVHRAKDVQNAINEYVVRDKEVTN
ncbi:glycosyltransferase [Chitinispirillales bacterium ANBcel5]|uniref:CgeB family protein n=1 Tax=Cellulosispirillum alkaliphilum TaxID=3039283 RepID=UPI002A543302|nr:glycosyltransferase [Chitinispirillales bacterium ANBcel5]